MARCISKRYLHKKEKDVIKEIIDTVEFISKYTNKYGRVWCGGNDKECWIYIYCRDIDDIGNIDLWIYMGNEELI